MISSQIFIEILSLTRIELLQFISQSKEYTAERLLHKTSERKRLHFYRSTIILFKRKNTFINFRMVLEENEKQFYIPQLNFHFFCQFFCSLQFFLYIWLVLLKRTRNMARNRGEKKSRARKHLFIKFQSFPTTVFSIEFLFWVKNFFKNRISILWPERKRTYAIMKEKEILSDFFYFIAAKRDLTTDTPVFTYYVRILLKIMKQFFNFCHFFFFKNE